jgi:transketolase
VPQIKESLIKELEQKAILIRRHIVQMMYNAGGGHIGGSLSATDILTALYFHIMRINPDNPDWKDRDRLVLSKGHAAAALYATMAEKGYFPRSLLFNSFISAKGILQEHPDMRKVPGIDMSSGSLGQGLSVGVGMALAAKLKKYDFKVFVLLGDGEVQEGQIWEAAMAASHYRLDNITAIMDYNKLQVDGFISSLLAIEPITEKWKAFGWDALEIDGHNMKEILKALENTAKIKEKPTIIIAHTIKGKGISFIENKFEWHSKPLSEKEKNQALEELVL